MNARKRRAPEPLLPLRSAKVPRTTQQHPLGGNATPNQIMGLGARWRTFGHNLTELVKDTIVYFTGEKLLVRPSEREHLFTNLKSGNTPDATTQCTLPPTPPPLEPPLRPCSSQDIIPPSRDPTPPLIPPPPARHSRDHPPARKALLLPAPSQPSMSQTGKELVVQKTGLLSPPTTHSTLSSSASSGSFTGLGTYPDVEAALEKVRQAQEGYGPVRVYRDRQHIYAKSVSTYFVHILVIDVEECGQHKVRSRIEWKKTIEEMEMELFELHRKYGTYSV